MTQVATSAERAQILFVAWQDQSSRQYFPVARLARRMDRDGASYEFCYLQGARKAQTVGFTHFMAFPDLEQVYRSEKLFPLFENRLMPRSRPDFGEYVQRLDLDPQTSDDLEILARSGGRRVTDSLELFPMPDVESAGCYVTYFLVHGVRYLPPDAHRRIERLLPDERLFIQLDFQNSADHTALSLRTEDRVIVGYMPRYILPDAFVLMQACPDQPVISVAQLNLPPAPLQQRLLCRMEACWPDTFKPYCTEDYQPVATSASKVNCP